MLSTRFKPHIGSVSEDRKESARLSNEAYSKWRADGAGRERGAGVLIYLSP